GSPRGSRRDCPVLGWAGRRPVPSGDRLTGPDKVTGGGAVGRNGRFPGSGPDHRAGHSSGTDQPMWSNLAGQPRSTRGPRSPAPETISMATDTLALRRIDHVRMFVGNARQSAYFYRNAFGFDVVAYAGLETGLRHEACYVLRQGQITFVLASPL